MGRWNPWVDGPRYLDAVSRTYEAFSDRTVNGREREERWEGGTGKGGRDNFKAQKKDLGSCLKCVAY